MEFSDSPFFGFEEEDFQFGLDFDGIPIGTTLRNFEGKPILHLPFEQETTLLNSQNDDENGKMKIQWKYLGIIRIAETSAQVIRKSVEKSGLLGRIFGTGNASRRLKTPIFANYRKVSLSSCQKSSAIWKMRKKDGGMKWMDPRNRLYRKWLLIKSTIFLISNLLRRKYMELRVVPRRYCNHNFSLAVPIELNNEKFYRRLHFSLIHSSKEPLCKIYKEVPLFRLVSGKLSRYYPRKVRVKKAAMESLRKSVGCSPTEPGHWITSSIVPLVQDNSNHLETLFYENILDEFWNQFESPTDIISLENGENVSRMKEYEPFLLNQSNDSDNLSERQARLNSKSPIKMSRIDGDREAIKPNLSRIEDIPSNAGTLSTRPHESEAAESLNAKIPKAQKIYEVWKNGSLMEAIKESNKFEVSNEVTPPTYDQDLEAFNTERIWSLQSLPLEYTHATPEIINNAESSNIAQESPSEAFLVSKSENSSGFPFCSPTNGLIYSSSPGVSPASLKAMRKPTKKHGTSFGLGSIDSNSLGILTELPGNLQAPLNNSCVNHQEAHQANEEGRPKPGNVIAVIDLAGEEDRVEMNSAMCCSTTPTFDTPTVSQLVDDSINFLFSIRPEPRPQTRANAYPILKTLLANSSNSNPSPIGNMLDFHFRDEEELKNFTDAMASLQSSIDPCLTSGISVFSEETSRTRGGDVGGWIENGRCYRDTPTQNLSSYFDSNRSFQSAVNNSHDFDFLLKVDYSVFAQVVPEEEMNAAELLQQLLNE